MSAPAPRRLRIQPGEVIDRTTPVGFTWDRTPMTAFRGDTIVSALNANGTLAISKSADGAGFFAIDADDPHCVVRTDREWNVRAGHRLVTDGMHIEPQTPWTESRSGFVESSISRMPNALVSRIAAAPVLPAYRRLRGRFGGFNHSEVAWSPGRYAQRTEHVDVLIMGAGPAGLSAAVAASAEGASVHLVDERHFLGAHLRWGDDIDRSMLEELVRAVDGDENITVMLGATSLGRFDDGWCVLSQQNVDGLDERLTRVRAGAIVESINIRSARGTFEGAGRIGVVSADAARMLINLYAVAPGDRVVILGGTSEADSVREDFLRIGSEIAQFVDPVHGHDISAVGGSRKSLAVTVAGGPKVEADLVVVGRAWSNSLPRLGSAELLTGRGVVGLPVRGVRQHEELVAHGVATGRRAARQAGLLRQRLQDLTPRARAAVPDNPMPLDPNPLPAERPEMSLSPSIGALAAGSVFPVQQSAVQPWHQENGGVQSVVDGWIRTDHYGDPSDEIRRARSGVGVHDLTALAVFVLHGVGANQLLATLSPRWATIEPGQVHGGGPAGTQNLSLAGRLNDDTFFVTTSAAGWSTLHQEMIRWISRQPPTADVSVDMLTAGYTGIRLSGPHAMEVLSRLSDGILRDFPVGRLDRVWAVGVADCILMRPDSGADPIFELHVPSGYGLHIWTQIFALSADIGVTPVGFEADRIMGLERGWVPSADPTAPTWGPGPSTTVGLRTEDPALVPTESCRVVEADGARTVGRVLASGFSPTFERSVCVAQVGSDLADPGTRLAVVNPDGERIAVSVIDGTAPGA